MGAVLEVLALHVGDARRARDGGADRLHLVGEPDADGKSPVPDEVEKICAAVDLPVRVTLRLREGFGTDGGEFVRLRGLAESYRNAGAEGIVMGFVNGHSEIDVEVMSALLDQGDWPWTCHRAIDTCLNTEKAWATVTRLPRLDYVLSAGSARGVEEGLDDLLRLAGRGYADVMMVGGGLAPEHVPWLTRAGVRAFHLDTVARLDRSWKAWVDSDLVSSWRKLVDDEWANHGTGR